MQVLVLRMQTADSIEEKIWQAAEEKLQLSEKVVSGGLFDRHTDANCR